MDSKLYNAVVKNSSGLVTYRFKVAAETRSSAQDKVFVYLEKVNDLFTVEVNSIKEDGQLVRVIV